LSKIGQLNKDFKGTIKADKVVDLMSSIGLTLASEELDYVILCMYKQTRDTERLSANDLLKLLKDIIDEYKDEVEEIKDESIKSEEEIMEEAESISDKEEPTRKFRLPISHSLPQEQSDNPLIPNAIQLAEEEVIETAQKVFSEIARMFQLSGVAPEKHFKDVIVQQGNDQLVSSANFLQGIEALGIAKLSPKSQDCLLKVLAATEDEKYIRFNDFMQVIGDYANATQNKVQEEEMNAEEGKKESTSLKEEFPMKIHKLNKVSMIVMLALAEYLKRKGISIEDLFEGKTYKQLVKTKVKQRTIDILNTADFFEALDDIGIKVDDEQENLKYFLCLDKNYSDKIHLKKLVKVMKEFTENEKLKEYARECYKELLGDADQEEHDNDKSERSEVVNQEEEYSNQADPEINY
jgi:hypothetical protein